MKGFIFTLFTITAMVGLPAYADSLVVSNIVPSPLYTNGDAIDPANISGYQIDYSCGAISNTVLTGSTEYTFSNVPAGLCDVTVATVDSAGVVGEVSSVISVTTGLAMSAPTFNVTVGTGTDLSVLIASCQADVNCEVAVTFTAQ